MDLANNFDLLSVGIAVAAIGILGFVVFFNNVKSVTNASFLLFALVTILWGAANYLSYHISDPVLTLWFLRLVIFFAVWHAFSFFNLFYVFPHETVSLSKLYRFGLQPWVIVVSIITLTPVVFSRISILSAAGQVSTVERGPGIVLFIITIIFLVIGGIVILLRKTRRASGVERKQFKYILAGTVATFSLIIIFNFLLPAVFQNVRFIPLGAIFILPFVVFTAYAIIKHKLLNVKVVAAEMLTFILAVVTFLEALFSQTTGALILRIVIFGLVLIFGILLIRSVHKEVEEREKLQVVTHELEKANAQLKELDRQKTDFLSIAAHQLRTPLSIINGYVELIGDGAYGKVTKATKDILHNMDESNGHLVKLIDEFLNITRIEQGRTKFDFAEHDMVKLIDGVVAELSDRAKQNGLTLVWAKAKLPTIVYDEEKVRHVVFNFVDNAIKYTTAGDIAVTALAENDGVSVRVRDKGFGFGPIDQANFFQKFYRGENVKNTNVNGTGLGLYVCRKFIESHGGHVWAKSPGLKKGSEFGFWIPLKPTEPSEQVVAA